MKAGPFPAFMLFTARSASILCPETELSFWVPRIRVALSTPDVSPDHEMESSNEATGPDRLRRVEPDGRHCLGGTRLHHTFVNNVYQSGQYDNFSYGPGDIGVGH